MAKLGKNWLKSWGIVQSNLHVNSDFLDELTKLVSVVVNAATWLHFFIGPIEI